MNSYNEKECLRLLEEKNLNGWTYSKNSINKSFSFDDFKAAFLFMGAVAHLAEKANHHPDWSNVYSRVNISLSTHDANGVTEKDFFLATEIEKILG